jgi:hypothetical protein
MKVLKTESLRMIEKYIINIRTKMVFFLSPTFLFFSFIQMAESERKIRRFSTVAHDKVGIRIPEPMTPYLRKPN